MMWTLNTDGACRGNPGKGAAGVVIKKDGYVIDSFGSAYRSECTNNVSEYRALIYGLRRVRELEITDPITVLMDSELIVKQLRGEYKVKHKDLKPLFEKVQSLLTQVKVEQFVHVPRAENAEADKLANQALDQAKNKPSR